MIDEVYTRLGDFSHAESDLMQIVSVVKLCSGRERRGISLLEIDSRTHRQQMADGERFSVISVEFGEKVVDRLVDVPDHPVVYGASDGQRNNAFGH